MTPLTADDKCTWEDKTETLRCTPGSVKRAPQWGHTGGWGTGKQEVRRAGQVTAEELEGRARFEELFRRQIMLESRCGGRGGDTKGFPSDPIY